MGYSEEEHAKKTENMINSWKSLTVFNILQLTIMRRSILIYLLILAVSSTPFFCQNTYSAQEQKQENKLSATIASKFTSIQNQSFFFYRLIDFLQGNQQPFSIIMEKGFKKSQILAYPFFKNIVILGISLSVMYVLSLISPLVWISSKMAKIKVRKIILFAIVVFLVYALNQAWIGFKETEMQRKSLNLIMCKFLRGPEGFFASQKKNGQGYEALQSHIQTIKSSIYKSIASKAIDTNNQVRYYKKSKAVFEFINSFLQQSQKSQPFAREIKDLRELTDKISAYYQDSRHRQCIQETFQKLLSITQFTQYNRKFTNSIAKNKVKQFSLQATIEYIVIFLKALFLAIILTIIASVITQSSQKWRRFIPIEWLQSLLAVFSILCISLYFLNISLLPHLSWANSSASNLNPQSIYQQLTSENVSQSYRIFFNPQEQIKDEACMADNQIILSLLQPYKDKNQQYVYDIYLSALMKIKPEKKSQLQRMIQPSDLKIHLQPIFKKNYEFLSFYGNLFVDGGDISSINPSAFATYIGDVLKTLSGHALNRVYSLLQILKNLSFILIVLTVLSMLTIEDVSAMPITGDQGKGIERAEYMQMVEPSPANIHQGQRQDI